MSACKECRDKERLQHGKLCSVVNSAGVKCQRIAVHLKLELCNPHWERLRRKGDVHADIPIRISGRRGSGTIRNGYKLIGRDRRQVPEHRIVMERILGRALLSGENVHHLNGDRMDNRPENLELWYVSQPSGQRAQDLVEYVAKYHADAVLDALGAAIQPPLELFSLEDLAA